MNQFAFEFQNTAARLAGALNSIAKGATGIPRSFTAEYLVKALEHLDKSEVGLEGVARKALLDEPLIAVAMQELLDVREDILKLILNYGADDNQGSER